MSKAVEPISHHYVPQWYQRRFLEPAGVGKFFYLDMAPDQVRRPDGTTYVRDDLLRWGSKRCFCLDDFYTLKVGSTQSTELEQFFFGDVDRKGKQAVEWFADLDQKSLQVSETAFSDLLHFMSVQKLRTPKGLDWLESIAESGDRNLLLYTMHRMSNLHCAIWAEAVWAVVNADETSTKFIVSDHPVTVYNRESFPESKWCKYPMDPAIWQIGTHTLFPLSPTRALILTNLSWVRNPYQNGFANRPNPNPMRQARMFDFREIQCGRQLIEEEVLQINYIIKKRAKRYIAATREDWLHPEQSLQSTHWRNLDDRYLLMPDPRGVRFYSEMFMGFDRGPPVVFDEYGRRPGESGFSDEANSKREWRTSNAFKGEYARLFGPKRRGLPYDDLASESSEDDPEYHQHNLDYEAANMPTSMKKRRDKRAVKRAR